MNESKITAAAQLDAAIESQRATKLASLQRKATLRYGTWVAYGLLAIAVILIGAAYIMDRAISLLFLFGMLLVSVISIVAANAARRRQAAKELENELRSRGQLTPNNSFESDALKTTRASS